MTRVSTTVDLSSFTTDAKFRTWGSTVSAALTSCGLVATSDTGQINWTTVNKPVATVTKAGYEIRRFNDSMQATAPIYLKLEFGSGGVASGNSPAMWLTVGTGSDGAGNLTGLRSSIYVPGNSANTTASANTACTMLFTHTDGYLLMYSDGDTAAQAPGSSPFHYAIDRTRNQSTGVATARGMHVWHAISFSASLTRGMSQCFAFDVQQAFIDSSNPTMPPGDQANYGGYVFPYYTAIPEPLTAVGFVGHMAVEIAAFSTFTLKPIGTSTTRTYIALPCTYTSLYGASAITGVAQESNTRTAFLWED